MLNHSFNPEDLEILESYELLNFTEFNTFLKMPVDGLVT